MKHFEHLTPSNIHCSHGSVCLLVFVPYLLISLRHLILFCFARKRQGNNSKTRRKVLLSSWLNFKHTYFLSYYSFCHLLRKYVF